MPALDTPAPKRPAAVDISPAAGAKGGASTDVTALVQTGLRPGRPRWLRLCALVPAILLLVVAVWEIIVAARAGHDIPGDAAWERAARLVRERMQPGDLIVFAPSWIDPVGRLHLGDLMPVDTVARMDDARFGTVWELSIRGAVAAESHGRDVAFSTNIAGVRVRKLVTAPAHVVTDFVAAFPAARVQGKGNARVVLAEVGFAPHRCVQAQPRPDQTVRVVYENVALGTSLVGYAGLADIFTRRDIRAPGRIEVAINDQVVAHARLGVDDNVNNGWVQFAARTTPDPAARVEFRATAVGARARQRLICFAAEARK